MLLFGRKTERTCQTVHRRAFLQAGASSVLGLSAVDAFRIFAGSKQGGAAKRVILLWLWGGPSHLDTWDPKPEIPIEYRGPFSTIPTRTSGLRFCELFPQLAARTDKIAVLRSLSTQSNDHGVAGTIGLTGSAAGGTGLDGRPLPGSARPALGAVVAKGRKSTDTGLPPYLVVGGRLHQGKKMIVGEGGGPLGAAFDPFRLEYDPKTGTKVPALQLPPGLTPERLQDRQSVRAALDAAARSFGDSAAAGKLDAHRLRAFALLTSIEARTSFDLSLESDATVKRYGKTRFGQSCLLARRLVEAGVPVVQVNWSDHVEAEEDSGDGGWDHHYRNFEIMQDRHAVWLDQALSALLDDLQSRGLLDSTLVVAIGEFGRTPKINEKAGRDHWPGCYSALLAGGGIAGGRVVGGSDAKGEKPRDTPVTPADLCTTVYRATGLTSENITGMGLTPIGRVIDELF
ncbi:MAG TPA: DUF1501 domain-containing protein [Fimbriiglobus sp.]|jgi:hypothetical protein